MTLSLLTLFNDRVTQRSLNLLQGHKLIFILVLSPRRYNQTFWPNFVS